MTSYAYYEPPLQDYQGHYESGCPWVVFVDDPCDCCGNPSHVLKDCPIFYEKMEAYRRREDEKLSNSTSSYYHYEEENRDYDYGINVGHNNFEPDISQGFNYQEEPNEYYDETSQDDATLDKIMELLIEMKIEMKKENEERNRRHDTLVKQVCQLAEDVAQLKRDREDLANGIMIDDDVVEEVVDLPCYDVVSSNASNGCIPLEAEQEFIEEPTNEIIAVCPNHSLETKISMDMCRDEGSNGKKRKVSLQDLGQITINWPQNCVANKSMASEKLWAKHINYRSFIGNSVGKCGVLLFGMGSTLKEKLVTWHANYRAYVGNVVGKCATKPP